MATEWFEADIAHEQLAHLFSYDHHRFLLDDRVAVLMTHVAETGRAAEFDPDADATVLAVCHEAADRHPALPPRLAKQLGCLRWRSTSPPPAERG